jgi:hypothetical protein
MSLIITPTTPLITDDTSSAGPFYPALATTSSGSLTSVSTTSTKLYFAPSTGQLNATELNSLSDRTKKIDIATFTHALDTVKCLRGVSFRWADTGRPSLGLIAQEVEDIIPMLVSTGPEGEKTLSYGNIVGVLIEAIKEQQKQIDELKLALTNK